MLRNIGALLTTEDETVDLGEHAGRRVRGVVQRRVLRFGLGAHGRVTLYRLRPLAVEVDGERVAIAVPLDPWVLALQRALLLLVVSMVLRGALPRRLGRALPARRAYGPEVEG